jgi:hypothetical protein
MSIHSEKCIELGLPVPKGYETQPTYIVRCISGGFNLNTRICRFIGIHNLHSIISALFKKGIDFTLAHDRVLCPSTGEIPTHPVDVIYMTKEQQAAHPKEKPTPAS